LLLGIAAAIFFAIGAALFAARLQPEEGRGQPGPSAWEWIRNFFAPAPPPPRIMGAICIPEGAPDGNQAAPQ